MEIPKVILSKKGLDSSDGNTLPNLIWDDEFVVFPMIDSKNLDEYCSGNKKLAYRDMKICSDNNFWDYMEKSKKFMSERMQKSYDKLTNSKHFHADPNLINFWGTKNFVGSLGQCDIAQDFLNSHNIRKGDIFLFFNRFTKVNKEKDHFIFDCYFEDRYVIYGYLIVDEFFNLDNGNNNLLDKYDCLKFNPHIQTKHYAKKHHNNTIYVGRKYGMFNFNEKLILTSPYSKNKTNIIVPELANVKVNCETKESQSQKFDQDGRFTLLDRCQEYVLEENEQVLNWALELIKENLK